MILKRFTSCMQQSVYNHSPENYNYIKEMNMINTIKTFNQLNREIKLKTYFKLFPNTFDFRNLNNYFKKLIKDKFNHIMNVKIISNLKNPG